MCTGEKKKWEKVGEGGGLNTPDAADPLPSLCVCHHLIYSSQASSLVESDVLHPFGVIL